jgi:hypothetical protein
VKYIIDHVLIIPSSVCQQIENVIGSINVTVGMTKHGYSVVPPGIRTDFMYESIENTKFTSSTGTNDGLGEKN